MGRYIEIIAIHCR